MPVQNAKIMASLTSVSSSTDEYVEQPENQMVNGGPVRQDGLASELLESSGTSSPTSSDPAESSDEEDNEKARQHEATVAHYRQAHLDLQKKMA